MRTEGLLLDLAFATGDQGFPTDAFCAFCRHWPFFVFVVPHRTYNAAEYGYPATIPGSLYMYFVAVLCIKEKAVIVLNAGFSLQTKL
jgi:hypothetical protein